MRDGVMSICRTYLLPKIQRGEVTVQIDTHAQNNFICNRVYELTRTNSNLPLTPPTQWSCS